MFFLLVLAISNHRLIAIRNIAVAFLNLCQHLGIVLRMRKLNLQGLVFIHADLFHTFNSNSSCKRWDILMDNQVLDPFAPSARFVKFQIEFTLNLLFRDQRIRDFRIVLCPYFKKILFRDNILLEVFI